MKIIRYTGINIERDMEEIPTLYALKNIELIVLQFYPLPVSIKVCFFPQKRKSHCLLAEAI